MGEPSPVNLTAQQRMLVQMRDTLYEGCWEDFVRDLQARSEDRPHVFETVPDSPEMKATIKNHLAMIVDLQRWEEDHHRIIRLDDSAR